MGFMGFFKGDWSPRGPVPFDPLFFRGNKPFIEIPLVYIEVMITVATLTNNNHKTIAKALESAKGFDEIVILDTGSTDDTLEIAKKYQKVKIHKTEFSGFGTLRNLASKLAKNDWVFVLDSDEEITEELFQEISTLALDPNTVYSIPFHNYYNMKHIKSCGWFPDYHVRLYNKKVTRFDEALIHEGIITKGLSVKKLKHPINHYSYRSIDDFLVKMQSYSSLFAKQNHLKKKSSFLKAITHSFYSFFKCYILKKGITQGKEGLLISIYNANTTFYKYLKLDEINKKK
jgi:glycosyltransferase involved in cell wall biosynthesis